MLVDYLSYLIGVALHKCLECRVCVVCLNVAFSDDAVACTTEVRIGNLFRASLTQMARVAVETSRRQVAHAVVTLTQLMTSCTERRVALNAAICTRHHLNTITIDALQYIIAIACETPCRRLTCLVMQSKRPSISKKTRLSTHLLLYAALVKI